MGSAHLTDRTTLSWTRGGELLINVYGHGADKVIGHSLNYQRTLWEQPGDFRRTCTNSEGTSVSAIAGDHAITVWNIATGDVLRVIASESVDGPLLRGKPDVLAMWERFRAYPIRFEVARAVSSLRAFAGGRKLAMTRKSVACAPEPETTLLDAATGHGLAAEPLPWRPMADAERAAALHALAVPAEFNRQGPVSSDGEVVAFSWAATCASIRIPMWGACSSTTRASRT